MIDEALQSELLELVQRDEETRQRLARSGALFDGYAAAEGRSAPADFEARQLEIERWARKVGWIVDRK